MSKICIMIRRLCQQDNDKDTMSASSCTTRLLFSVEKMKLFQKEQVEMAKLISRFTNNEECPFWPLFL